MFTVYYSVRHRTGQKFYSVRLHHYRVESQIARAQ